MALPGAGTEPARTDLDMPQSSTYHKEKFQDTIFSTFSQHLVICARTLETEVACKRSAVRGDFIPTLK